MAERTMKGTVTPLSSLYPVEEVEKALMHVRSALNEKNRELEKLNSFIADNTNLINRVRSLPDELHHDIMVPFGKVAFFPGRLVHTNEFLVLLGEGYYSERTSKQTIEILRRRGDDLESQADALKADIKDIESEASFFENTASEANAGLVEIREEIEPDLVVIGSKATSHQKPDAPRTTTEHAATNDDEEYARIMSRFDELEKEELAAEYNPGQDVEMVEGTEVTKLNVQPIVNENMVSEENKTNELKLTGSNKQSVQQEILVNNERVESAVDDLMHSTMTFSNQSVSNSKVIPAQKKLQPKHDSSLAFTGSILERTDDLRHPEGQIAAPSSSKPSKPVSRFKMRRS